MEKNFTESTTIYYNGRISTMDPEKPFASCVCCEDGVFTFVGEFQEIRDRIGDAEMVDLGEMFVYPGFIDLHSMPAVTAFLRAVQRNRDPRYDQEEWFDCLTSLLTEKGVTTICLHREQRAFASLLRDYKKDEIFDILEDVTYRPYFEDHIEEDPEDFDDYYEWILGDPETSNLFFHPIYNNSDNVKDALRKLTLEGAKAIGQEDRLGTITVGKRANMAIFEDDPGMQGRHMNAFMHMECQATVVGGRTVSNLDAESTDQFYNMFSDV